MKKVLEVLEVCWTNRVSKGKRRKGREWWSEELIMVVRIEREHLSSRYIKNEVIEENV